MTGSGMTNLATLWLPSQDQFQRKTRSIYKIKNKTKQNRTEEIKRRQNFQRFGFQYKDIARFIEMYALHFKCHSALTDNLLVYIKVVFFPNNLSL